MCKNECIKAHLNHYDGINISLRYDVVFKMESY